MVKTTNQLWLVLCIFQSDRWDLYGDWWSPRSIWVLFVERWTTVNSSSNQFDDWFSMTSRVAKIWRCSISMTLQTYYLMNFQLTGAKRREWMGMGVAWIMIHSYCGLFPHSLGKTHQFVSVCFRNSYWRVLRREWWNDAESLAIPSGKLT